MNKDRLEWIMSGLNRYALSKTEDQFVRTAVEDFDKNHSLSERQEERLETLYKEKSSSKPNRNAPGYFSFKESPPKKARARRLFAKDVLTES